MGSSKRHQRSAAPPRQTRTRTRQHKGTLVSDPVLNTQLLTEQLRALGLYAASTLGDGNCLFRALSDQYYGSPSQHLKLREEICEWMAAHKQRYEPFVDDERGLDVHLRCMRQQGTYGGHLELSAFAHLKRRNVKVIQPGLVYVIEWAAGGDPGSPSSPAAPPVAPPVQDRPIDDVELSERDRRRLLRDKRKEQNEKAAKAVTYSYEEGNEEASTSAGAVYVAYHDWEHFSSVRNLTGPHTGLPNVVETPSPASIQSDSSMASVSHKGKPTSKASVRSTPKRVAKEKKSQAEAPVPARIPLPLSRSVSPSPPSDASASGSSTLSIPPRTAHAPLDGRRSGLPNLTLRINRSPKRTFDESSGASSSQSNVEVSQGNSKRSRSTRRELLTMDVDVDVDADPDADADTPSLFASGSSAESSSSSLESSPAPTPPPTMVVVPPSPMDRPLTRRQRKAMGLPKPRAALGSNTVKPRSAPSKIVIPGGRYKKGVRVAVKDDDDDEVVEGEWKSNGTGRLDVRGFRELKI